MVAGGSTTAGGRLLAAMASGGRGAADRVGWVDSAKAVTILLVVGWHLGMRVSDTASLFIFVPMPLFFFVGGFFASKSLMLPWRRMADSEGARLLYLYVVWSTLTFLLVNAPAAALAGREVPWARLLTIFVDPFQTLWFAYALALTYGLARLFAGVPREATALLLLTLYTVSVGAGNWFDVPFADRLVRLLPFFFLGVLAFPTIKDLVPRHSGWWPAAAAVYVGLAALTLRLDLAWVGPLTMVVSLVGVGAVLLFCGWLQRFEGVVRPINLLGASSFCVFALHRIVIFYWRPIGDALDLSDRAGRALGIVMVVAGCLLLGAAILRWAPWLFDLPRRRGDDGEGARGRPSLPRRKQRKRAWLTAE